ncbi:DUF882 domain-containing protein [Pararhizobium mangrovi]|uniref:DUF882 domain-containing protein n=1 Tax=Pararhizobium mangrovi TaxID=2590452 RepID=UPI0015E82C1B|nr:DUF882 domain-containing protein [Pararhizobium mangrovi]
MDFETTIGNAPPCRRARENSIGRTGRSFLRFVFFLALVCAGFGLVCQSPALAATRSLKVVNVHTGEKAIIAYKRNGRYISSGLQKLNYILRDWREDKEIKMDPRMIDLLWEVYQKSGSNDYINIICGYRTGKTNAMLRGRSRASGVAKQSQHTLGKAVDFFIPDVRLSTLREIGMKFQVGGVGYYPNSGSPFVHMDTGWVRAWPRMSRTQLVKLFPDGKTLHLPPSGKPLSGYQQALASYKQRVTGSSIAVAGGSADDGGGSHNLLAALFGRHKDKQLDAGDTVQANPELHQIETRAMAARGTTTRAPTEIASAPVSLPGAKNAPLPGSRPEQGRSSIAVAMAGIQPAEAVAMTPGAPPSLGPSAAPADDTDEAEADAGEAESAGGYADLLAYAVPVPGIRPAGDTSPSEPGVKRVDNAADATAALIAEANVDMPADEAETEAPETKGSRGFMPVPGDRPMLTAFASPIEADDDDASRLPAFPPKVKARPASPTPSAVAEAGKRHLRDGEIRIASLAKGEIASASFAPAMPEPKSRIEADRPDASVEAVRGGRVNRSAARQGKNGQLLTAAAVAQWAMARENAHTEREVTGASTRTSRLPAATASTGSNGRTIDPERFAAVRVYFPRN